jgi:hypothetical protein
LANLYPARLGMDKTKSGKQISKKTKTVKT